MVPLPAGVPAPRAVLAANMETALNAVWDAAPGPADQIAIVGGGVVGSLVAWLCGRMPGTQTTLVDVEPARAATAPEDVTSIIRLLRPPPIPDVPEPLRVSGS